jgi:hypothetical protein
LDLKQDILDWLLEDANPSVKYRTLTELLDRDRSDTEITNARKKILQSKEAEYIFSKLDKNGLWPHIPKNFGNYTTTYYLMALSELGLDKSDKRISRIVEWYLPYLSKVKTDRCAFVPLTLRTLILLGYNSDQRVRKLTNQFLDDIRFDGGYLCGWKQNKYVKKGINRLPKSCIQITGKALLLLATLPDQHREDMICSKIAEYFLRRQVIYKAGDLNTIIVQTNNFFPLMVPYTSLYIYLYALSALGYGNRPELDKAWSMLLKKQDEYGRFMLEQKPAKTIFPVGKVGHPSKWVTFYIYLASKYKANTKKNGRNGGE